MSKEKEIETMFLGRDVNLDDEDVFEEEDSELVEESEVEEDTDSEDADEDAEEEVEPSEEEKEEEKKEEELKEENQLFELKHLGSTRTVGRDEVVALAQKGLDYDRIRSEYDSLKKFKGKDDQLAFLDELSKAYKQPIDEVIEDWRIRQMAEDQEISEDEAKIKYYKEKAKKAEGKKSDEEIAKAKMKRDFDEMTEEYPDLDPKDIPKEVWDAYRNGKKSLLAIYSRYEREKIIKEGKEREEKMKKSEKNAKRSMGSVKTAGKGKTASWGSGLNDDL